ncbi:MAG: hypothetical protein EAX95_10775 [Candidatus Thorarchaeota archaeon]|nr:hypothetical protein [Candidatus Thorarchaeota archaeon]
MSRTGEEESSVKQYIIRKAYGKYFLLGVQEEKDLVLIQMARAYGEYLNGPMGESVLKGMKEGEEFTLRFEEELLKVTKHDGRAVVQAMKVDSGGSLFKYSPV